MRALGPDGRPLPHPALSKAVPLGKPRTAPTPREGIHPAAFGLRLNPDGRFQLRSRAARFALGRYLDALALVLGQDWLTRPAECPLLSALRRGAARVAPCSMVSCPHSLVGHLAGGWPVLYRWEAATRGEETCALYTDAETLESIGELLGVTRERVRQLEARALSTMHRRLHARGVV